ncbi:cell division protein FtsX [Paraflavitalea pollutisoli]|uniref:cell division protein FtsX n=1 Tax=Paraflavitalea pollutisoli TaxID=3034143 RepID=UPI0023EB7D5B|nr:permease-like cell division protein FtsX [Paraflavitalea sp. H1-2-19X]
MAQFGKGSAKRSKPSYFMAILGVTIVLFFVGIFGWLLLNARQYTEEMKEDVKVQVFLKKNITPQDVETLKAYIAAQPYTKSYEYIDQEAAKQRWLKSGESDFKELLEENPLPASFDVNMNSAYVHRDSVTQIKTELEKQNQVVESVQYPAFVVEKMTSSVRVGLIVFAILAGIFCIFSIVLIDNTIRLAMYSNRFIIKTMQMVGATRGFIARPMTVRAIVNGTVSALIAIAIIYVVMMLSEHFLPYLADLRDNGKLLLLFAFLVILGISISLFSTYRSVLKYLKMKLDDLY